MDTRNLLISMAVLQVFWLMSIWFTGAATHWEKLPVLLVYSLVCIFIVSRLSADFIVKVQWFKEYLIKNERRLMLVLGMVVFVVGVPSVYLQRGWPDEMHVFAAARIVAEQGVEGFFANYLQIPWLGMQHPPLVLLLYGGALQVFGTHLFVIRIISLLCGLATLILTYQLGRTLYERNTGLLAAVLFLTIPFFFRIGAAALLDMPATFVFVLSLFLTLRLLQAPTVWLAVATGFCVGAGLLCRYTVVLIYPIILGTLLVSDAWRHRVPHLAVVILISAIVVTPWMIYSADNGILTVQESTIASYASYAATTGKQWLLKVLLLRLPSGLGVFNLPMLLLGGEHLLRRRSRSDLFVMLWIATIFFPLMGTLPAPRYFFPAFPALAIVMACGVLSISEAAERLVILALLYAGGTWYLFVDWFQAAGGLFRH